MKVLDKKPFSPKLLNTKLHLFQKTYKEDTRGGRTLIWKELGWVWAYLQPVSYVRTEKRRGAYKAVVRNDATIFMADRVLWEKKELFLMHSPQHIGIEYLKLKLFYNE